MPRKGSRKNNSLSKKQKMEVAKIVNKKMDARDEDKRLVYLQENIQLYHNKPIYVGNFLSDIQQGTSTGDDGTTKKCRVGDRIRLKNINMRFWLSNKDDRPNVMYKAVLFWYQQNISSAITDDIVYMTQQNKMLDRYNDKSIKIIDTFIVKSTNNYAVDANNHEKSYLATLNKSYKSKYVQFETNSKYTKGWELGIALVCYDAYGTLQSDNIASYALNSQLTFEDA